MKIICIIVSAFFILCSESGSDPAISQPDDPIGKIQIGGNNEERAAAVVESSDGGFVIAGYTKSSGTGGSDIYIVKTNSDLEIVWERTFGGSEDEEAWTITATEDGGYICSGSTESFGAGDSDIYLVKIDDSGNEIWSKTYGGQSRESRGFVQETTSGDLIISGWKHTSSDVSTSDMYLLRTNSSGDIIWENTYGGSGADGANSVRQTSDGGFVVYGEGLWDTTGEWQGIMFKTDSDGNLLWGNTYGSIGDEEGYGMQIAHDGGFVAVGFTRTGNITGGYLLKTDSSGEQEWMNTFRAYPGLVSVERTSDGGYIIYEAGMRLLKTDSDGIEEWSHDYNGGFSFGVGAVKPLSDGGYVIVGTTHSSSASSRDMVIFKTDGSGVIK